jgi:error-prone DNA polymerase
MVGLEQESVSLAPKSSRQEALFVELAARSAFSLLTGASTPEALAERAAEIEMPTLALTDLFDLGGVVRFTRSCDRLGVRPIVGAEVRVIPPLRSIAAVSSTSATSATRATPARLDLFLLCMDREGYHNLCGLITQARLSNPRGHPVLEIGALKERGGCAPVRGMDGFLAGNRAFLGSNERSQVCPAFGPDSARRAHLHSP